MQRRLLLVVLLFLTYNGINFEVQCGDTSDEDMVSKIQPAEPEEPSEQVVTEPTIPIEPAKPIEPAEQETTPVEPAEQETTPVEPAEQETTATAKKTRTVSPKIIPSSKKISKASTTKISTTTSTHPPTTTGRNPLRVLCVMAQFFGDISIQYTNDNDETKESTVGVTTLNSSVVCAEKENQVNITWTPPGATQPFNLGFIAKRIRNLFGPKSATEEPAENFEVTEVNLQYKVEETIFPGAKDIGAIKTEKTINVEPVTGSIGTSFVCKNKQFFNIGKTSKLSTTNFQFEAFRQSPGNKFGPPENMCDGDKFNYAAFIPAMVGVIVAVLVAIVVVSVVLRRRRYRGYTKV